MNVFCIHQHHRERSDPSLCYEDSTVFEVFLSSPTHLEKAVRVVIDVGLQVGIYYVR